MNATGLQLACETHRSVVVITLNGEQLMHICSLGTVLVPRRANLPVVVPSSAFIHFDVLR